ncbi:MAG TPA: alpha/beta hydrolase, partial [Dongiaceae bacterium]|nr:alpha/beta hydrolase [Dongiaceae bacterium]
MPHFKGTESEIWFDEEGPAGAPLLVWVGGGGTRGRDWQRFQTPHFAGQFRNLVFDNRGIGGTRCNAPLPWPIESFARDLAELSAGLCNGPAIFIGSSLGSAIVQQLCIDRPDLVKAAIVMGSGAWSTGWGW